MALPERPSSSIDCAFLSSGSTRHRESCRPGSYSTLSASCRVLPPMSHFLAETAPTWARTVAPIAEHIAQVLLNASTGDGRGSKKPLPLPTPLTQAHRSAGRDGVRQHATPTPRGSAPKIPSGCRMCGVVLNDPERVYCDECLPEARKGIVKAWSALGPRILARLRMDGSDPAHGGIAGRKRGQRISKSSREIAKWSLKNCSPVKRADFLRDLLPKLKHVALQEMVEVTGLSVGTVPSFAVAYESRIPDTGKCSAEFLPVSCEGRIAGFVRNFLDPPLSE